MILTNPHIVFYNRDNEIVAGVVEMPDKSKYKNYHPFMVESSKKIMEDLYQQDLKQALINPIPFKEKEDEEKVKREVWVNQLGYTESVTEEDFKTWEPYIGKPYKIEGEIEISCNADCPDANYGSCCHPSNCQKFAFLKPKEIVFTQTASSPNEGDIFIDLRRKSKDVFDTGARLPEQKEEGQITEEDFRNFIRTYHLTDKWEKFIHRKP